MRVRKRVSVAVETPWDLQPAVSATYDLQIHTRCVFHVLDLHLKVVLPRVGLFRLADEEDGVHLAVPDAGERGAKGLPVLAPRDLWPGLSLEEHQTS